ncbi:hypothetical protein [Solimonas sp. SE-A11]|uniref:hypothetical protein n=1 Tax=Solimonas sp. SE-A11 TaxID=3054954 RepID=UPI00259CADC8|nr:hypothetical protein [Solimonas sp. SE-A11]MDM4768981.1 hypothetical protein [Solimonas sp. SE-A11]
MMVDANLMRPCPTLCLALLACCLLVSGCAAKNIRADYEQTADKGVMLGSVTRDGRLSAYRVLYRPLGQEKGFEFVETGCDSIMEPSCYAHQDFTALGMKGDLFAVELPPGDYEFFSWDVVGGSAHAGPASHFSMKYRIQPGRITYIDNFHFTELANRGLVVTSASVDYTQPFERDWALAQKKYARLRSDSVDVNEFSPPASAIGGTGGYSFTPTPVYLPLVK